jgi:septal ring factor EnvC (AmiA/AmiB activator)
MGGRRFLAIATVVAFLLAGCGGGSKPLSAYQQRIAAREARKAKHRAELRTFVERREAEAKRDHRPITSRQIAEEWLAKRYAAQRRSSTITVGNAP